LTGQKLNKCSLIGGTKGYNVLAFRIYVKVTTNGMVDKSHNVAQHA